jgi:TonB family protein
MLLCAVLGGCLLALALTNARAAEPTPAPSIELCPVYDGYMGQVSPSVYSFDLTAQSARTVHGNLAIETDRGWFRLPFGPFALTSATRHFANLMGTSFTDTNFRSPIMYVNFEHPVTILNWWVERGAADLADWTSAGLFTCYPNVRSDPNSKYNWRIAASESNLYTQLPAGTRPMTAIAAPPIEKTDCAKPFADATIDKQVSPTYPFSGAMPVSTSQIKVTIMPDGRIVDAKVFKSSGIEAFDIAAMDAAARSTYHPKIAYCRPTIGVYLFKVTYVPR